MKQLLNVTAALALLAISVPVFAQQGSKGQSQKFQKQREGRGETQLRGQQRGRGMQRGGRGGQGSGGLFRLLDVDRDGKLSAKEIDGAVAALMKLDANKDGTLDAQELVIRGKGRPGRGANSGKNKSREDAATQRGQKQ